MTQSAHCPLSDDIRPTYLQMLDTLGGLLSAATSHGLAADQLFARRLAPDMKPFADIFQYVCLQAREGVARLAGELREEPAHPVDYDSAEAIRHTGAPIGKIDYVGYALRHKVG